MKNWYQQARAERALDIKKGSIYSDMCGEYVRPVDVTITWKQKAQE